MLEGLIFGVYDSILIEVSDGVNREMAKNIKPKSTRTFNKVQVKTDKGVLRLQFPKPLVDALAAKGVKFSRFKSLGKREIDPDTGESHRPWAEAIASRIQADLDHPDSLFDPTLVKYLDVKVSDNIDPTLTLAITPDLTVGQLWENFLQYHLPGKAASTKYVYENDYSKKLRPFWNEQIDRETASKMRGAFLDSPNSTSKKALQLLAKAVDWAVSEEKISITKNPFKGMSEGLKSGKKRLNKVTGFSNKFVAFTQNEVELILSAFLQDDKRRKYYDFYKFKFLTGCRTGEAIALTWDDINFTQGVILFNKTYLDRTGLSEGTKTEDSREFPLNSKLADWLCALKQSSNKNVIFPGERKKYMCREASIKAWSSDIKNISQDRDGIVVALAKQGKLEYLPP
ncbi:MAG: tyrosine-type recombinase/integrase [Okeania sp. SIO2H7]|nr:tyrosine-type recombinase/integrase [Okeania sp. SIO2H7]